MEKRKVLSIREVTSISGSFYDMLKNDIEEKLSHEKKKIEQRFVPLPISFDEFCNLFLSFGTHFLLQQNQNKSFEFDQYNEPIIKQLFLYLTRDSSFAGDLEKGIMLQGKYGCGKTVLMGTYLQIHNYIIKRLAWHIPNITFIKSSQLQEQLIKQSHSSFEFRPLIIDEFGREAKTVQDFGNILHPVSELLSIRSDNNSMTHGTTNFTWETLSSNKYYGGMIGDRLKMMFNFIPMRGESRRK
ncbi:P-loop NTPase family protein [Massilibacteroides vaginae]|uniref:hypothetical protein n=1 Tax=Massilibacteroides vaginae TaxID=1673718 RepID=UPI00111C20F7|nr:hypothetical protein [Massilibacteroides vaginae]